MTKAAPKPIPVIYILSNGRSGSTLLDLLLGAHPQIWTLGEAMYLPLHLRTNRRPCGCGTPIEQCTFWKDLLPSIRLGEGRYPIGYFLDAYFDEQNKLRSRQLRFKLFRTLLYRSVHGCFPQEFDPGIGKYGEVNAQYFRTVLLAAQEHRGGGIRWLVDASKNPNRLFWLKRSGGFAFRVILLLRDPRGFANSLCKPERRRSIVLRSTRRWLFNNLIFLLMAQTLFEKDQVLQVWYEELTGKPEVILEKIGQWLGVEDLPRAHQNFRNYVNHAISGNPMRWEKTGLFLDEKWKTEMPLLDASIVHLFTWPFRQFFHL